MAQKWNNTWAKWTMGTVRTGWTMWTVWKSAGIVKYVEGVRNVKSVKRGLWDPFETTLTSLRGYSGSLWAGSGWAQKDA